MRVAGAAALVVVDGVIMGSRGPDIFGSSVTSSPGGLQELNPDDIDRIEILKGPAASTLYGLAGHARRGARHHQARPKRRGHSRTGRRQAPLSRLAEVGPALE
ncbi:MAG TPA: TonB-dependent receptor plug domain-containing protein [Longimicrobiales bacterium]